MEGLSFKSQVENAPWYGDRVSLALLLIVGILFIGMVIAIIVVYTI